MIKRIETEYDPSTGKITITYGTEVQKLFKACSETIAEVVDERVFSELCDELGDSGPRELASGAILLSKLSRSLSADAHGEELTWALSLVAWTILRLATYRRAMGNLPLGLVALAFITPVELPEMALPSAEKCFGEHRISSEAWNAYEDLRVVENVKLGAIPTVATAYRLWKEIRSVPCSIPAFHELLMRLESASMLFRHALQAIAKSKSHK